MGLMFVYAFTMLLIRYHDSSYANPRTVLADAFLLMTLVSEYIWAAIVFFEDATPDIVYLPFVWHVIWLVTTVPVHTIGEELKHGRRSGRGGQL